MLITCLSSGGENDLGYIKPPQWSGILQPLWPHSGIRTAVIVHILSLQSCWMCLRHLLCHILAFRKYALTDVVVFLLFFCHFQPHLRLQFMHRAPEHRKNALCFKCLMTTQDIFLWKMVLRNSSCILRGFGLNLNMWTSAAPTRPACMSLQSTEGSGWAVKGRMR